MPQESHKSRNRLSGALADEIVRRYIFKLHPTRQQADTLHEHRRMFAQLWNALKQRHEDTYRHTREKTGAGKTLSYFDLTNEITELRHKCPEWARLTVVSARRVAKHLTEAYAAFFHRLAKGDGAAGYPRWQSAERATTIPLGTMAKTGWRIDRRTDNPHSWLLYYGPLCDMRDRTTWMHARGWLPGDVKDWRNADIIFRDGAWWLSVCVCMAEGRRAPGRETLAIRFGALGALAEVNGVKQTPDALLRLRGLADLLDELKSERDLRWPRHKKRSDQEQSDFREACEEIRRLECRIRRGRADALHVWSAHIVERAATLTIEMPRVSKHTRTPRGDAKQWGAEVQTVSALNRDVRFYAPAMAAAMLQYKAAEATIPCEVKMIEAPEIAIGAELKQSRQILRRAARTIRKAGDDGLSISA